MRSRTFRVMMVAAVAAIPIGVVAGSVQTASAGGFSCGTNSGWSSSNAQIAQPRGGAPNPCDQPPADQPTTTTQPKCKDTTPPAPPATEVTTPQTETTVPPTTPPTEVPTTVPETVPPTQPPASTTPTTTHDNTPLPTVTTTTLAGKLVPPVTATSNPTSSTQPQTIQIGTGILAYTGVSLWLFFIGLCCLLAGAAFLIKMFRHRPAQCQSLRLK